MREVLQEELDRVVKIQGILEGLQSVPISGCSGPPDIIAPNFDDDFTAHDPSYTLTAPFVNSGFPAPPSPDQVPSPVATR